MKTDIHPDYRPVVFLDTSSGEKFLTRSTIQTEETTEWEDGNTYPLAKIEISSASHPFFTGQMTIVDTAGRVERFERRYGKRRRAGSPAAKVEEAPKVEAVEVEETPRAEAVETEEAVKVEETPKVETVETVEASKVEEAAIEEAVETEETPKVADAAVALDAEETPAEETPAGE